MTIKFYKTVILHVVLYGCEVWSVTDGRRRLRVFENRVLWKIFGPKRDEVTGDWRRLHSEALHDLYTSPYVIRVIKASRMGRVGAFGTYGREEG
jgi:hypothetical protein